MNGFIFIDKPKGMTSFDVVRDVKRKVFDKFGKMKVGHSGTLDPIATGLLIIAIGESTKLLEYLLGSKKTYRARGIFGAVSDTYDADGEVTKTEGEEKPVTEAVIKKVIQDDFVGEISQVPPKYSAKKVNGKRAYDLARAGEDFELKPSVVEISRYDIIDFDWPNIEVEIACGSGTYVRSLIHDLGQELKVGAYMSGLVRLSVSGVELDEACSLDEFLASEDIEGFVHSDMDVLKGFPMIELNPQDFFKLKNGGFVLNKKSVQEQVSFGVCEGEVVGVIEPQMEGKFLKFKKRLVK